MNKKKNQATEKDLNPIEGNNLPAYITVEFTENDVQAHVRCEVFELSEWCKKKHGSPESYTLECCLTNQSFEVSEGGLVYSICVGGDVLEGWLHPQTVARGNAFIKERLKHLAHLKRDQARWGIHDAIRLEAATAMEIEHHLPEPSGE